MKYLIAALTAALQVTAQTPADSEIRKVLEERIRDGQGVGIVVGVIRPAGRSVIAHGSFGGNDARPVDADTVFEIGSVTKVFTALLLADMAQQGEVALSDPVAKFLPRELEGKPVRVPDRAGKQITLEDLAIHTSGLPRLPDNFVIKDMANPYAAYTVANLYQFLSSYQLPRDIGSKYEYSNLGGGLLGHALALRSGKDYEEVITSRICGHLDMKSTRITLTAEMRNRFAPGHNDRLQPAHAWDLPTLAGAGALRSTANDMLRLLAAALGYEKSGLAPALNAMLKVRKPTGMPGLDIALGWHVLTRGGQEIVWHNGGTGGYRSFVGYSPKSRSGVAILSNTTISVDDLGYRFLGAEAPVPARKEISVNPKLLENYTGRFQLAPGFILTITREGGRLFAQATGQVRNELFVESEKKFFLKVVDAQLTFETDEQGRAMSVTLHQGGRDMPAKRLEGEAPAVRERKEITVAPQILERYVGRYELAPNVFLTVRREEGHLYGQLTGQPAFEIYPEAEREFFYKVVDAQITFETGGEGKATHLVLRQNGIDRRANRVE
jgi:CubicO group peptidase (beta-lactamase class C family)